MDKRSLAGVRRRAETSEVESRLTTRHAMVVVLIAAVIFAVAGLMASPAAEAAGWNVTMSASSSSVTVGERITISATAAGPIPTWGTSLVLYIVDADTGQDLNACQSYYWTTTCGANPTPAWSVNHTPQPMHFRAELRDTSFGGVAAQASLTVPVNRYEWDVKLSASANPATVGSNTTITATATGNQFMAGTPYRLYIVDADTGQDLTSCQSAHYNVTTCNLPVTPPWSSNGAPQTLRYRAEVRSADDTAGQASLTVPVKRYEWDVQLSASANPVTVGSSTTITATATGSSIMAATPYRVYIVNADTGQDLTSCAHSHYSVTSCAVSTTPPWSANTDPEPLNYRAEVRSADNTAGQAELTVDLEQRRFAVSLSFPSHTTSDGVTTWLARASVSPTVSGTGFLIRIRRADGTSMASCSGTTCDVPLGEGTYYATVEGPDGTRFGQSSYWTLSGTQAEDQSVEGINTYTVAAAFNSATQLCNALLTGPGTHVDHSTVTDQYFACSAIASTGGNANAALKAALAAAGGTIAATIAWYLSDHADRYTDPATGTVSSPVESPADDPPRRPIPLPPPAGDQQEQADIDKLMTTNPGAFADRDEAKVALRSCRTVATRSDCLSMPIFIPGDQDMPQTTKHDREAIFNNTHPQPSVLNWAPAAERMTPRNWYDTSPFQPNPCEGRVKATHACDEYPFSTTRQNGADASLKPVVRMESSLQGGHLNGFYARCDLRTPARPPFIVAPAPAHSDLPTLKICNGR